LIRLRNGKQSRDTHEFSVGMMGKFTSLQYEFIKKSSRSNVPHIYICQMQQYVSTLTLKVYKGSLNPLSGSLISSICWASKKYCLLTHIIMFESGASYHPGYHRDNAYIHDKPSLKTLAILTGRFSNFYEFPQVNSQTVTGSMWTCPF